MYAWLYFAQYALVFDGKHSWHALLFSRDLMRKRFFKVATRIVVFLAVWSGFNSWAAGAFVVVSLLFGPVGVVTGFLGTTIFLVDLCRDRRELCDHCIPGRGGLAAVSGFDGVTGAIALMQRQPANPRCSRRRNCRKSRCNYAAKRERARIVT